MRAMLRACDAPCEIKPWQAPSAPATVTNATTFIAEPPKKTENSSWRRLQHLGTSRFSCRFSFSIGYLLLVVLIIAVAPHGRTSTNDERRPPLWRQL